MWQLGRLPRLDKNFPKAQSFIHPVLYERTRHAVPLLKTIVRCFPQAVYRAVRFHLNRRYPNPL